MVVKRPDYETCKSCTHTEQMHDKFDGRSPKRELECHAYKCSCKKYIAR